VAPADLIALSELPAEEAQAGKSEPEATDKTPRDEGQLLLCGQVMQRCWYQQLHCGSISDARRHGNRVRLLLQVFTKGGGRG
jgi:hypothetical protein